MSTMKNSRQKKKILQSGNKSASNKIEEWLINKGKRIETKPTTPSQALARSRNYGKFCLRKKLSLHSLPPNLTSDERAKLIPSFVVYQNVLRTIFNNWEKENAKLNIKTRIK